MLSQATRPCGSFFRPQQIGSSPPTIGVLLGDIGTNSLARYQAKRRPTG